MKLIIDIPETMLDWIKNGYPNEDDMGILIDIVLNGTQQRPNGQWERMSEFPIEDDNRFRCSRCGNVVHHKSRINLYTFNQFCGRCGSYNIGDDIIESMNISADSSTK